jgi:pimeloyl-ACP methyl ester carboxylesterase
MAILTLIDGALGKLDEWYFRYHCHLNRDAPPMFHRGWGSQTALAAVNGRWNEPELPRPIDIAWETDWSLTSHGLWTRSGSFPTPLHVEHLPPESARAYVHFVRPTLKGTGAVVVLPPTSREAGVAGRLPTAWALAREGISSMLLESPYMGRRKPQSQHGATLQHFSDFLVLCAAAIEEARAVLAWLAGQGFRELCTAGISKGGYLATVAGLRSSAPAHVVALLPPDSGVPVLIDGLLGRLCDWDLLQRTSGSSQPVKQQMIDLFEPTSLVRLPAPASGQRVTLIAARRDRYVPRDAYERLAQHWKGRADVRWLGGGHVSTIAERGHLIRAIIDTLRPR